MGNLVRKALMGNKQAQEECTEKGIALPCPLCGDDVTITEIPAHIWSTVHPAMRLTAILNGGERRMKRQIQDCWRNSREK